MVTNIDIRVLMLKHGLTQADLAGLIGASQPEISMMLKHEMSQSEKRRIKDAIMEKEEKDEEATY